MARIVIAVTLVALIGLGAGPATAIDHKNLDEGRPLRLDDAYAISTGETDAGDGERDGRYKLALGGSYPVGAPKFTRATLVADVFTEQSVHRGQTNVVGTELGLRYQLTPRVVWDVGVGTEFAGPRDRSRF